MSDKDAGMTDNDAPKWTYDELLAEMESWRATGQKMNRKLLAIMDVLDEMKASDDETVLLYYRRLWAIL